MKLSSTLLLPLALGAQAVAVPKPRNLLGDLTATLSDLVDEAVNRTLEDAVDIIGTAGGVLANIAGYNTTANDLLDGDCGDVLVIFARGTVEQGNMGGLVGPEFVSAVKSAFGSEYKIAAQGVNNYTAVIPDYFKGGSSAGSKTMADYITKATEECTDTKIVVSGYSQGAQLVHNAASQLDTTVMGKVTAVVNFGDPYSDRAVDHIDSDKVLVICHENDYICDFGPIIDEQHLNYVKNVSAAASFVAAQAAL